MKTKIVNLKHEKYDIYIGRSGHNKDGYFGRICPICRNSHNDAGDTIRCYTIYFISRMQHDTMFKEMVLQLRGKVLGCFCKPGPCHGDVIKEYLDEN